MRRPVFLFLGVLEFVVAAVLIAFGCQLPGRGDIDQTFARAERVTRNASGQVRVLQGQVHDLRRPELQDLALKLQAESKTVTSTLKVRAVDFDQLRVAGGALGDVADGLDGFADTLDADGIGRLGDGLGEVASYLDEQVVPSAGEAAARLEATTKALREDARRLGDLVRQAPPDLKAASEVHDSLGRLGEGLDKMQALLKVQRVGAMRDGFRGLETSLTTGAEQVERLSGYHYPVVTFRGLRPEVEQRKFWPEGDKIAEGMRKAAAGARAADEEMGSLEADLPGLRASLEESRKVADRTREALGVALKQQDKVEALLKDLPQQTARLADELPKLGGGLARILRDTERLKDVAAVLRQAQRGMDLAVARWPELRRSLSQSATLLRGMRRQLHEVVARRQEYEAALEQTIILADTFASVLPLFLEGLDKQLQEQERGLGDLGRSIDDVGDSLPAYREATAGLVRMGRLLAWLVAAVVALHGTYLVLSVRLGKPFSLMNVGEQGRHQGP
jgi:ABC-type transporter Mla subunit MlaD